MKPEKLYIPTSTLNFNNIMSSESVSPAKFYSERGFGYKRFEKVEPNHLNYSIILYNQYPVFDINDKELENYPMVIEVDIKSINEDVLKKGNENTYFSEETIYINPISTRFFFRNKREQISTLAKAEPSIEAKMVSVYSNCFCILDESIERFDWRKKINKITEEPWRDTAENVSRDRRINKLKGFLYAYLIGYNKKTKPEIISLKKISREIKNVLSAIIINPQGYPTNQQKEKLNSLFQNFEYNLEKAEGISERIDTIIKEESKAYRTNEKDDFDIIAYLKDKNLYGIRKEDICLKDNFSLSYNVNELRQILNYPVDKKQDAFEYHIAKLDWEIKKLEAKFQTKKLQKEHFPKLCHNSIDSIPEKKEFLVKLYNEYLAELWNKEEFVHERYEFAKAGGKIFKEEIGKEWDTSPARNYINGLLTNLNEFTAFDINIYKNQTLNSFAAFCQKGDDIDKLEDYLIANNISDFEIAFGLWGIVLGFADMPKTLTDDFFNGDGNNYISNIYMYIHKQVHGVELDGNIKVRKDINTIYEKLEESFYTIDNNKQQRREECPPSGNSTSILEKELSSFSEYNKLDSKVKRNFIEELHNVAILSLEDWDEGKVDSIKWKSKKGQITLIKAVKNNKKSTKSNEKPSSKMTKSIKEPALPFYFYSDKSAWSNIKHLVPIENNEAVKRDIDWFQNEYLKGNDSQYYAKASRSNKSVIESYERHLKKEMEKGKIKWFDISSIINKLKELYL